MVNMEKEHFVCCECGESIEEDDDFFEPEPGVYVCSYCYEDKYIECAMCGSIHHVDEMEYWGDCRICQDCLEDQCPSFDQAENDEETNDAYEAIKDEFVGKKVKEKYRGKTVNIDWGTDTHYSMSVNVDNDCKIVSISRISAETLLWESDTSSEYRLCAVDDSDYEDMGSYHIEKMLADGDN